MSGHSHFSRIKHKKSLSDLKRGKTFSKICREISVAVKENGGDFEKNARLRLAIEKAKQLNMPKENIERAIQRGRGGLAGENLEDFLFEALGPGGIAFLIEGITDNKNRTLNEIKQILSRFGGKMANEGSLRWMFEKRGVIKIQGANRGDKKNEKLEILAIEGGAEDIYWENNILNIYTKPAELEKIKNFLEENGIHPQLVFLKWAAKKEISIEKEKTSLYQKLFKSLDENESIQEIYSNLKVKH